LEGLFIPRKPLRERLKRGCWYLARDLDKLDQPIGVGRSADRGRKISRRS